MKNFKGVSVYLLSVIVLLSSCSDDDFDPGVEPEIPPVNSMEMDITNFTEGKTSQGGREMSQANWTAAAVQVGIWNTVLVLNLAIPVAAFKASIAQRPTFDRERQLWVWNFDYNFVGRTYTSELTADLDGDEVTWNMHISQENGFQNVLWYTGVSKLDGSSGYWIVNRDANNPIQYLRIDWSKTNDEVGNIKYTNITEGSDDNGSFIEYGLTDGTDYNVFYTIDIKSTDRKSEIEWNSSTGAGRVEYDDSGEYFCWDTNFDDIDC